MNHKLRCYLKWLLLTQLLGASVPLLAANYDLVAPVALPATDIVPKNLNELTNDTLLKQLQKTYDELQSRLQIKIRMVTEGEVLLERVRKNSREVNLPPAINRSLSVAETLEYIKPLTAALKKQLKLREDEKAIIDQYGKRLTAAQTEIDTLLQESQKLDDLLLQVDLRINDNTLSEILTRKFPNTAQIQEFRQSLFKQKAQLLEKAQALKSTLEVAVKAVDDAKKNLLRVEAVQQTAKDKYAQIQKRRELEQAYYKKSTQLLRAELAELQDERGWLQSTFEVATHDFMLKREAVASLASILGAMTAPAVGTTGSDIDPPFEALVKYHEDRLQALENYRLALDDLIKTGEVLQADASGLNELLFKMQAMSEVLERQVTNDNKAQENLTPETRVDMLKTVATQVSNQLLDVAATLEHAQQELLKSKEIAATTKTALDQTQKSLASLNRERSFTLESRKWVSELQSLNAEELATRFHATTENVDTTLKSLEQQRAEFDKIDTDYAEAMRRLTLLKGPLARQIQAKKPGEQVAIVEQLYRFAGLELPKGEGTAVSQQTTAVTPATDVATPSEKSPQTDANAVILTYQQLLFNQLSTDDARSQQQAELLTILRNLEARIDSYLQVLSTAQRLSQQQRTVALEIKKRVGRGELKLEAIPDGAAGITAALKRNNAADFDAEHIKLLNKQLEVRYDVKRFSTANQDELALRRLLVNIDLGLERRLDLAQQIAKLESDFMVEGKALAPVESKTREQVAARRMRNESQIVEVALSFFHSTNIDGLTDLLLAYYSELIELEDKQETLSKQKEKYKSAIGYLTEEKKDLNQLVVLLKTAIENASKTYETELVKIKLRLAPDKARELLGTLASQAGHELLTTPPLLNMSDKPAAIARASQHLYEIRLQVQVLEQWLRVFEARLLPTGTNAEITQAQDKISELDTRNAALQRRMAVIRGHKPDALLKLAENEKPKNPAEWENFYNGEIGTLRTDRLKLYQNILFSIAVQLMLVVIGTYIALLLLNLFTKRLIRKTQQRLEQGEQTAQSSMSMINLLRRVAKFFIWSTAAILALDVLGFNTAAILAGLGIGGIGVAMASREVLADVIGGITMMIMRFYKVGDRILFKGSTFLVKDIGISYTTIENDATKHIVNVPNARIAASEVVNVSSHPGCIILTDVRLATSNDVDKVRQALVLIKEIITTHPGARFLAIKHDHFNDFSFVINFKYDVLKFGDRTKVETDINCEIVRRFQEQRIKFTQPTVFV